MRRFANVSTSTCSTPSSLTALLIDPIAMSLDGENGTPRNTLPSSSRDTKPNVIWQTELGTSKCHSCGGPKQIPVAREVTEGRLPSPNSRWDKGPSTGKSFDTRRAALGHWKIPLARPLRPDVELESTVLPVRFCPRLGAAGRQLLMSDCARRSAV